MKNLNELKTGEGWFTVYSLEKREGGMEEQ